MAKIEWGIKRICQACGALFYDLNKDPITCPKCDTGFDPEAVLKSRRTRTVIPENVKPKTSDTEDADEEETIEEAEVEIDDDDDVDANVTLPEVDADEEIVVVPNDDDVLDDQSGLDDDEDEELLKIEEE